METPRCSLDAALPVVENLQLEISVYLRKHRRSLQSFKLIRAKLRSTHKYSIEKSLAVYLFRRLVYFIKEYLATP